MALEQATAYLEGSNQDGLGETVLVGPDRFAMLQSSELKNEHQLITNVLEESDWNHKWYVSAPEDSAAARQMLEGDNNARTRCYLAMLERTFAFQFLSSNGGCYAGHHFLLPMLNSLMKRGVDMEVVAMPTLKWATIQDPGIGGAAIQSLIAYFESKYGNEVIPDDVRSLLLTLHTRVHVDVSALIGSGLWDDIALGEVWTDRVMSQLSSMDEQKQSSWRQLLRHCQAAKGVKPGDKWLLKAKVLRDEVSIPEFKKRVVDWFAYVDKGSTPRLLPPASNVVFSRQPIPDQNSLILRGLVWLCPDIADRALMRSITAIALSGYRKVYGPRDEKLGNAAVSALGEIGNEDAVGQLAILKAKVKFKKTQKLIGKCLTKTAEKAGVTVVELEEMSVPTYGLTQVGIARRQLGEFTCELVVSGSTTELIWLDPEKKRQKSVPPSVKSSFPDELKELKQAKKDIDKMITVQARRIEQAYLQQREWNLEVWKDRYHDHPLIGSLARRLIWKFSKGDESQSGIFHNGAFVNHKEKSIDYVNGTNDVSVSLWHPLDQSSEDAMGWRKWLIDNQVIQPFKQAHREVYILTDAERDTSVYSNRFAAHVLKQHQFNALCGARNWKYTLQMKYHDGSSPAHIDLDAWRLWAEFWVEGAGEDLEVDTNETGTFLYLTTDQVRFYDRDSNLVELDQIPALVFSEVMRDVDLFVGVSSIGNDPSWSDSGPIARYQEYWSSYSFGELSEISKLRKTVLLNLVPRLKIADRCSFSDRFLIVRGDLRTYKIHMGSGNILMEPNDQYLCIVNKQSVGKSSERVFLPFEGDSLLSIIISKAFLLAEDKKIKDKSIKSQIINQ